MKNLLLTGLICSLALTISAQVSEIQKSFSLGHKPAFSMTIKDADTKTVEAAWIKQLKGLKGKVKKNNKNGEIFADNAQLPKMSTNAVDVYAQATTRGTDVELIAWFDLGGAFANITTNEDAAGAANEFMEEFNLEVKKILAADKVELEEDFMKGLEGEMKNLVKKKQSLEESIVKAQTSISEAKDALENMDMNMKNPEKKKRSLEKSIVKSESTIAGAKTAIEHNLAKQTTKQSEIDNQAEKVKMAKDKLAEMN